MFEFIFIKVTKDRLGATKQIETPEGFVVPISSKARALIDAVYDWRRFNTLPQAYEWIALSLRENPAIADEITDCSLRFGNQATIRRIGYLLDQCGTPKNMLKRLKQALRSSKSLIPYIPGSPARGKITRDWGLIINEPTFI